MTTQHPRPNPEREHLEELFAAAQRAHGAIATALDRAHAIMLAGHTWTGPTTAAVFCDDIGFRRRDLRAAADDVLDEIRHALTETPVSLDDAA